VPLREHAGWDGTCDQLGSSRRFFYLKILIRKEKEFLYREREKGCREKELCQKIFSAVMSFVFSS
jgi:hypothetical protein